jgi:hypothetical protein
VSVQKGIEGAEIKKLKKQLHMRKKKDGYTRILGTPPMLGVNCFAHCIREKGTRCQFGQRPEMHLTMLSKLNV